MAPAMKNPVQPQQNERKKPTVITPPTFRPHITLPPEVRLGDIGTKVGFSNKVFSNRSSTEFARSIVLEIYGFILYVQQWTYHDYTRLTSNCLHKLDNSPNGLIPFQKTTTRQPDSSSEKEPPSSSRDIPDIVKEELPKILEPEIPKNDKAVKEDESGENFKNFLHFDNYFISLLVLLRPPWSSSFI